MAAIITAALGDTVGVATATPPTVTVPPEIVNAAGATAIGVGVGTSFAIENAGGWAAAAASTTGTAMFGATGAALYASLKVGDAIGTYLYNNSETVRDIAIPTVGAIVEAAREVPGAFVDMYHDLFPGTIDVQLIGIDCWEVGFVASQVSLNPFTHISP